MRLHFKEILAFKGSQSTHMTPFIRQYTVQRGERQKQKQKIM